MNLETIGTGAGSGLIGVILVFLGFRSRLGNIERKLEKVVFKDTFDAVVGGIKEGQETQTKLLKETRDDVKELLKK